LQKAKTEFIHTANGETKLPYCWAAPVLIGQSDAIVYKRPFPFVYFFSILAWIVVVFWLYRGRLLKQRYKA
jgi:hypothetical protein